MLAIRFNSLILIFLDYAFFLDDEFSSSCEEIIF